MLSVLRRPLVLSRLPVSPTRSFYSASSDAPAQALTDLVSSLTSDLSPPQPGPGAYPPPSPPTSWKHVEKPEVPLYYLHCKSSRNNTAVTFTKSDGSPIATISGGMCGFRGVNRSSYEAGYQCVLRAFKLIGELKNSNSDTFDLKIVFKGYGSGREAFRTALLGGEGEKIRPHIISIGDHTPIKVGGTRGKKARR